MFLTLFCTMAWGMEPAIGLGVRGLRGSDGLHRLQPAAALWGRQEMGQEGWFLQGEVMASHQSDPVIGGRMHQLVLTPAALLGRSAGEDGLRVHGAVGVSGFFLHGGLNANQWIIRPGVRGVWGLEYRVAERLLVGGGLGGTFRGEGGDVDLSFRVGRWP